jgi:hypothetical protein
MPYNAWRTAQNTYDPTANNYDPSKWAQSFQGGGYGSPSASAVSNVMGQYSNKPLDFAPGMNQNMLGPGGTSLGQIAGGMGGAGQGITAQDRANLASGQFIENPGASSGGWNPQTGYGTSPNSSSTAFGVPPQIAQYLDPSMAFQQAQGLRALDSQATATGGLQSGQTLKDILNYSQGLASTGYNNAFNQAAQQQGFGAGLAQQDWQNNLNLANTLSGMGQYGTTGSANANNLLATLLSQNTLAGGNAAAAGTIGGSNAITGGVSQAIGNMLQLPAYNFYNRLAYGG